MNATILDGADPEPIARRAAQLFHDQVAAGYRGVDRLFAVLLPVQWMAAIVVALVVSPWTWAGEASGVHPHVWAALLLGGLIVSLPIALALGGPGRTSTRQSVAIGQMLMGTLLIHLSGGRIETHFHVFGSLAFLALYRDWRVLATATAVTSLDHYLRGAYWPRSIFGVLAANPWRWVEHAAWVLFEVVVLGFGCFQSLRAIRGVARREAELEATRDQFERAVAGRTVELEGANESLKVEVVERRKAEEEALRARELSEAATRAKSEFLANMSHEIRTPMNGILGMTELALETDLSATQREYIGLVKTSADSLLTVLNDILDFSKIEAGKLDLDPMPFDLRESLEETMRALALRAHAKDLELACRIAPDVPDHLIGDQGRLRQVVVNLVGNAIKFTQHGEVVVSVDLESPSDGGASLRFSVADTGIGIPPEKQRSIFEPFEQADGSTTRKYGGTGLGLAISVKLVELMGGRIWVEGEVGRGSTFRFTARFGLAAATTETRTGPDPGLLAGLRVLVVDDNHTNRRILEEVLRNWGARPSTVEDGPTALVALREASVAGDRFCVALIDGMMPTMDGFELAIRIRDEPGIDEPLMVMLTSSGLAGEAERSRDAGIDAYLTKPVRQSELFGTLARLIRATLPARIDGPMAALPPDHSPPPVVKIGAASGLRILLAEDHVINQKVAVAMLRGMGHESTVVADGRRALEAWEAGPFDLILMDIQMPEMDGFEALAAIRARERETGGHVPIVALTAHAMKGDRERCLEAGFDDHLAKPIRSDLLGKAIEGQKSRIPDDQGIDPGGPTAIEEFDREAALMALGGDEKLLSEVVGLFLDDCPRLLGAIEEAIGLADPPTLKRLAHTLGGVASTFALPSVIAAARALEAKGADGAWHGAVDDLDDLRRALDRVRPALQGLAAAMV